MKKLNKLYIAVIFSLMFTSCGRKGLETVTEDSSVKIEAVPSEEESVPEYKASDIRAILESQAVQISSGEPIQMPPSFDILDSCLGDLNLDGIHDLAVIVQKQEENFCTDRTIYILTGQQEGNYLVKFQNGSLIGDSNSGGVYGDPYSGMEISSGKLTISVYGGSSSRWGYSYQFSYGQQSLVLSEIKSISVSTFTANGIQTSLDISSGMAETRTIESELFPDFLIFSGSVDTEEIPLDFQDYKGQLPKMNQSIYVPNLDNYQFGHYLDNGPLNLSAKEALDMMKDCYFPSMDKIPLPYSSEIIDNYSKLLGFPIPDYYYSDGEHSLYYYGIKSDAGLYEHIIADGENYDFYSVSDSGEILTENSD